MKRGGSLSFLVGTISNILVMEIGLTDVGSGGYILVSCAHSDTSFKFVFVFNILSYDSYFQEHYDFDYRNSKMSYFVWQSFIYINFIRESIFMDNLMLFKVLHECERLLTKGSSCLKQ